MRVYGSRISYYTGKLEAYLRYRGLAYSRLPAIPHHGEIRAGAGAVQHPVVRLEDGRWLSDTTPMLAWFESQQPGPSIYPADPALRFAALLLEDHADEWLWRSAMHYRWSHLQDRQYASGLLADEQLPHRRWPRPLKRFLITRRQLGGFVRGDGVAPATREHVEAGYLAALEGLEAVFAERPFLLGDAPSIADFGFMAPMLRHFGQDPTPAEIMRSRAPGVYEWVARMWNAKPPTGPPRWLDAIDASLSALLAEACETHLAQLAANAVAWHEGRSRYDQEIQGCRYRAVPSSRYRVWCLEELRRAWQELDGAARDTLRPHLPEPHAALLWSDEPAAESGYDVERRAPFHRAINVFGHGVPR